MNERAIGWGFVGVQVVLLVAVILGPGGSDWSQPDWLRLLAFVCRAGGIVILVAGAAGLGSNLTPTPVPVEAGSLRTGGLFGFMRHPIYTGVMLIVVGSVLGSSSLLLAAVGVITIVFFNVKARWEEVRLAQQYPGYEAYAAAVPRFIPNPLKR